jgi:hypothetical protein
MVPIAIAGTFKVPTVVRSAIAVVQVKGLEGECGGNAVVCGVRADGVRTRLLVEATAAASKRPARVRGRVENIRK